MQLAQNSNFMFVYRFMHKKYCALYELSYTPGHNLDILFMFSFYYKILSWGTGIGPFPSGNMLRKISLNLTFASRC